MSKSIIVRNLKFATSPDDARASLQADPIAVAFYTALSATFPHGEAFFVQSVAQFSKDVPPALKTEVDAFIRQEALHSREHVTFNKNAADVGMPLDVMILRAAGQLNAMAHRSSFYRLAITVALEHFTSVFAEKVLTDPRHLAHYQTEEQQLWQWHAIEEIEHKAVAIDVFHHVTSDWTPLKRYVYRSVAMVDCMTRLAQVIWTGFGDVLASQGLRTKGWRRGVLNFLFVRPGLLAAMLPEVLDFFKPGFHPNHKDDAAILHTARTALPLAAA
jgi:uncharacterized protein